MLRKIAPLALTVPGAILIGGGYYTIAHRQEIAPLVDARLGRFGAAITCCAQGLLPCGVAMGLGLILLGALLLATAVGAPPPAESSSAPQPRRLSSDPARQRWAVRLATAAVVFALLSFAFSLWHRVEIWAAAPWVATFISACAALYVGDRIRGTPLGNPFSDRWETLALLLIVALDLLLIAHDLTDWRWSGTPDEAHFFELAKGFAQGRLDRSLLSDRGVFQYHPVLASYYQSLFMKLLGVNLFAWRLSSAVALAGSLPFVYLLTRELWNRRAACIAAILFGVTPLAVGFAHLGYNNAQVYPVVTGALAALAWAQRRRSTLGYYLAGGIGAWGFYTYQPGLFALPLLVLLGISLRGLPVRRGDRLLTLVLALGAVLTALPAFAYLAHAAAQLIRQTGVGSGGGIGAARLTHVLQHWGLSVIYPFWVNKEDHFQSNPLVDPIAGGLAAVGMCLCVVSVRRRDNARFLLAAYLISALLVGATSPYAQPPLTRLLFLSPFTAMFAAVALDQLMRTAADASRARTMAAWLLGVVLVTASIGASVRGVRRSINERYHGYGDGTTTELVRVAQALPAHCTIVYVQQYPTGMDGVDLVLDEYGMNDRFKYLHHVDEKTRAIVQDLPAPFVVFTNLQAGAERLALEQLLGQRFPRIGWRNSDARFHWNVRYFYVPPA